MCSKRSNKFLGRYLIMKYWFVHKAWHVIIWKRIASSSEKGKERFWIYRKYLSNIDQLSNLPPRPLSREPHQYPLSHLTSLTTPFPFFILSTLNTNTSAAISISPSVFPDKCGVMIHFGCDHSGCPSGRGSGSVTSSAAPNRWGVSRTAKRSSVVVWEKGEKSKSS